MDFLVSFHQMINKITIEIEIHLRRCILATHYHGSKQASGKNCCYHYSCPLEARRKTKSGSILSLKTTFPRNSSNIAENISKQFSNKGPLKQPNLGRSVPIYRRFHTQCGMFFSGSSCCACYSGAVRQMPDNFCFQKTKVLLVSVKKQNISCLNLAERKNKVCHHKTRSSTSFPCFSVTSRRLVLFYFRNATKH